MKETLSMPQIETASSDTIIDVVVVLSGGTTSRRNNESHYRFWRSSRKTRDVFSAVLLPIKIVVRYNREKSALRACCVRIDQ
jgi:hypothetical protein